MIACYRLFLVDQVLLQCSTIDIYTIQHVWLVIEIQLVPMDELSYCCHHFRHWMKILQEA